MMKLRRLNKRKKQLGNALVLVCNVIHSALEEMPELISVGASVAGALLCRT